MCSKSLILALLFISIAPVITKGQDNKMVYKKWHKDVREYTSDFFCTPEAERIANNLMLYQQTTGGWPKNIYFPAQLTEEDKVKILSSKNDVNESTIDNSATTTEIRYMANMYCATKKSDYEKSVIAGINYLLEAQYDNGGWPQFYPRPTGYYTQITFNDNAMINVMRQLREIYENKAPFKFIPESLKEKAKIAFDKGIECILNCQVRQNGKLTAWCAQHDKVTLVPCKARAYELPSLSGAESADIVLLLMSLPNPSERVKTSIESAVKWFCEVKIDGLQRESFINADGKKDYKMVKSDLSPSLWARFYELGTNRPFFSDRDGVVKYDISQIGYERRNGYSWYNNSGNKVLSEYEKWKKKIESPKFK